MGKEEKSKLHLATLIQEVKKELIKSSELTQKEHEENGTPYLFELDEVELEIKFGVEVDAAAEGNLWVFSGKTGLSSKNQQTARIKLKVYDSPDGNIPPPVGAVHHIDLDLDYKPGVNHITDPENE